MLKKYNPLRLCFRHLVSSKGVTHSFCKKVSGITRPIVGAVIRSRESLQAALAFVRVMVERSPSFLKLLERCPSTD